MLLTLLAAASANASPITNGLVAEYRMDGNLHDDAGAANGAMVGAPSFVTSPYGGQALSVSPGNYGRVPAATAFHPGLRSFTIAVDFNSIGGFASPVRHIPVFVMQGGDFTEGILMFIGGGVGDPSIIGATLSSGGGNSQVLNDDEPASLLNQWHNVAVTVDRTSSLLSLYLDGVQVRQSPLTVTSIDPSQDFLFGAYDYGFARNGHARFISGQSLLLDNLAIYDRALAPTEIATLAHISGVPEPATWVQLVAAGLGFVAYRVRRRTIRL
ncbi:MAG: hypothetical protein NT069_19720 [Planctomycetota bacterium]|nr:hypothetical protein [Planctomycetota bacterium]